MDNLFENIHYGAVVVAAIVFWFIGMLWFSVLVGKSWAEEMTKHGIKIEKPTSCQMAAKCIWTFVFNLIVCFGIAIFVEALGVFTFGGGLLLGLILAICFPVATMLTSYIWESRSPKLSFYSTFYPFIGIIISSLIIALWH